MPSIRLGIVHYEHKNLVVESTGKSIGQQVDEMVAEWLAKADGDLHEVAVAFEPGDTSRLMAINESRRKR